MDFYPCVDGVFVPHENERQENGLLWGRKLISAGNYIAR